MKISEGAILCIDVEFETFLNVKTLDVASSHCSEGTFGISQRGRLDLISALFIDIYI